MNQTHIMERTGGVASTVAMTLPFRKGLNHCPALDIHVLINTGQFRAGTSFVWAWGIPIRDCVHVRVSAQCLTVTYQVIGANEISHICIPVEYVPAQFGGLRPMLVCPECNSGYYRLYFNGGRFACQRCHHLKYSYKSSDSPSEREARKQEMSGYRPIREPGIPEAETTIWAVNIPSPPEVAAPPFSPKNTAPAPCAAFVEQATNNSQASHFSDGLRVRDAHPVTATMVNPAKSGRGGRPRIPLAEVPCTCGLGENAERHYSYCKRAQAIRRRAKDIA